MSDDTSTPPAPNTPSKKLFLKMLKSLTECNKTINELTSERSLAAGVKRTRATDVLRRPTASMYFSFMSAICLFGNN